MEEIEEVEGEAIVKIPKKKSPKAEESRSKKEHVNVVFIGHVGELKYIFYDSYKFFQCLQIK